ncbi:hypothetical protein KCU91_g3726, partial [Aureobasidium melanogenum]
MAARRGSVVVDLMSDESGHDDPDTINPELHTSLKTTPRSSAPVSPEAAHFLKDLGNYVAIGSLVLKVSGVVDAEPTWEEIFHLATLTEPGLSEQNALDIEKLLARRRIRVFVSIPSRAVLRIYVLPSDVGHRFLQQDRGLDTHLFSLIRNLDVSPSAWNGQPDVQESFEMYATGEEGSLYYLFNNVPSPNPTSERITSHFHREVMLDLLDHQYQMPGLKTILYPYQRNSAAQMLQRECEDRLELDPRLEKRTALDGTTFYYEPWDVSFFRSPRFYESCKGGILAETMGLGKTLICITLILATRGYLPHTPAQYDRVAVRSKVASLLDMAISAVNRHSAPWPSFFERHEEFTGEHMGHCINLMRQNVPSYEIPIEPIRWNRKTTVPAPKKDLYVSPLKSLHFLRIIVDEGHGMATENTRIATVASKLVEASHRWIVSGTPAKDLIGVEMDLVGPVSHSGTPAPSDDANSQPGSGYSSNAAESLRRGTLLSQRKAYSAKDEKDGAVRSIGSMASHFLKIRPWCSAEDERGSDWINYFFRHEMFRPRTRTFSSFSRCLRQTLDSIVIRTQSGDVERDIELPPLTHEIVRLEPSFYDKLTVNAFVFVLTANAVTSERTDIDYIFHKNSGKERTQLLNNLRASAFYWTGFSASDMEAAIEQSEGYMKKLDKFCSEEDESLLRRCIDQAQVMVNSEGWKKLTQSHEVGLFVRDWPTESAAFWSFDRADPPVAQVLCGATQLIQAQDHVNRQTELTDPAEGLAGTGIKALSFLHSQPADEKTPVLIKAGIPSSSLAISQTGSKRSTGTKTPASQPKAETPKHKNPVSAETQSDVRDAQLPANSALRKTSIVGTTSAKLSYLLSRIEELYRDEKILVFYDNDNTAYYIAQALEVLHIDYLIYAKSLLPAVKADYTVRFNQRPEHRVLLMDVGQAAFGLNFPSASRVFFINPVNRPQVEAQALKRAHRIGQTREVHAETLILKGTIEEKIFERARMMSRAEHKNAKELDDDGGIREIIQNGQPIPVHEATGADRIAFIQKPQQLFARPGWAGWKKAARENSSKTRTETTGSTRRGKRKTEGAYVKGPDKKRAKKQK